LSSPRPTSSVCLSSPRPTYLKSILSSGELFGSLWYTDRSMAWRVRVEEKILAGGRFLVTVVTSRRTRRKKASV
jgi:hypothetical protein